MRPDGLQALSLAVADARALPELLARIVDGLAAEPGVALARIWLLTGDTLRLAASAGGSLDGKERWTRLDGAFRAIPLGQRKVGLVAATGTALLVADHAQTDPHIARPDWAKREKIRAFCGQPLVFRGQVLGVLAVFSRHTIDGPAAGWLRTFADHAAVAIANARAFEQLEQLHGALEQERDDLRAELAPAATGPLVGASQALAEVRRRIDLVAATDATVLVLGESGTGKELVATAIHEASPRRAQPIVRVNCAAIPSELFESEFFGHVKGAFTGALRDRAGKVQLAHRGTLFLDEIAEIPLALQPKLLRVLQERAFERVGDEQTRTVDVRFIAATNRDLLAEVRAGRFREDLYYRLAVFPIEIAPLRARPDDIAPLARRFVAAACARYGKPPLVLRPSDVGLLEAQRWPGNVRELMSFLERAVILSDKARLRVDLAFAESPRASVPAVVQGGFLTAREWRDRERENVRAALAAADGRIYGAGGAAALLGVKPTTLASQVKVLGIGRARRAQRS